MGIPDSELSPGVSEIDTRLAEIDRQLREIQAELVPELPAPESRPQPGRASRPRAGPLSQLLQRTRDSATIEEHLAHQVDELTRLQRELLASLRELLTGFGETLAQSAAAREVTLSVGPLRSIAQLRAFEAELSRLPGVTAVTVRGYEGEDRALIEVRLS